MTVPAKILKSRLNDSAWRVALLHYVPLYPLIYAYKRKTIDPILLGMACNFISFFLYLCVAVVAFDPSVDNQPKETDLLMETIGISLIATLIAIPGLGNYLGVKMSQKTASSKLIDSNKEN